MGASWAHHGLKTAQDGLQDGVKMDFGRILGAKMAPCWELFGTFFRSLLLSFFYTVFSSILLAFGLHVGTILAAFLMLFGALGPTFSMKAENVKTSVSPLRFVHFCKTRGSKMRHVLLFSCFCRDRFEDRFVHRCWLHFNSILVTFWKHLGSQDPIFLASFFESIFKRLSGRSREAPGPR